MVHTTHQTRWHQYHHRELERDQIARIGNEIRYLCQSFCMDLLAIFGIEVGLVEFEFGYVFLWRTFRTLISESVSTFLWQYILSVMNTPRVGNER